MIKKIIGANLTNRFYRNQGWSREDVANLLNKPDISLITERESFLDNYDLTYYAYYEKPNSEVRFLRSEIEKYEFVPFMNNTFEENNKLI